MIITQHQSSYQYGSEFTLIQISLAGSGYQQMMVA